MAQINVEETRNEIKSAEELAQQVASLTKRAEAAETALAEALKPTTPAESATEADKADKPAEGASDASAEGEAVKPAATEGTDSEAAPATTPAEAEAPAQTEGDTETVDPQIATLGAQIATLGKTVGSLEKATSEVSRLAGELEKANKEVTRLTGELSTVNGAHTALKSQVENLKHRLGIKGELPMVEDAGASDNKGAQKEDPQKHADFLKYKALSQSVNPAHQHQANLLAANNKNVQAGIAAASGLKPLGAEASEAGAGAEVSEADRNKWNAFLADRAEERRLEKHYMLLNPEQRAGLIALKTKNRQSAMDNAQIFAKCAETISE